VGSIGSFDQEISGIMEKKTKIKSAAGARVTRRNVEERVTAAQMAPLVKPCTALCAKLKSCPDNRKTCPKLARCGVNTSVASF
jgi:hypothetical protein